MKRVGQTSGKLVSTERKRKFFSLAELNQAIAELLTRLNERPFRKRDGCRRSLFELLDKPALRPLPEERYQYGDWETHRVNIDYHVAFDDHWYSVPYQLVQQEVEVRASAARIHRSTTCTPASALALSRGFAGRAGTTATP